MSDQLAGWLQVIIGAAGLLLTFAGLKPHRRHRRRTLRYSRWKLWGLERTRFESIDDSQS